MVRVGRKPQIVQCTDRWGALVPHWEVTEYGLMDEDRWAKVQDYQTPVVVPPGTTFATMEEAVASPLGAETKRKLDLAGCSTVWQMNLVAVDEQGNTIECQRGPAHPQSIQVMIEQARVQAGEPVFEPPADVEADTREWVRMFAVFGEQELVEWTDYDVNVRLPRMRKLVAAYNARGYRRHSECYQCGACGRGHHEDCSGWCFCPKGPCDR